MPTVHLIIRGKVQGVFYRASTKEAAERLGLTGWVRNLDSGDVEIMATGASRNIEDFITWCRKGPANAKVTAVELNPVEEILFDKFRINR